jgi:poly-gamma-glutamate synthesis protein (capsule biosynthesis protein)
VTFPTALLAIARVAQPARQKGDILVASIHWGGNWGYQIGREEVRFAHELIDTAGFDVVHGHSSHHPKAIEIYHEKPILYGCGDFINDYEGIGGYEEFRSDLTLMYLPRMNQLNRSLVDFRLVPFKIRKFQLQRAAMPEADWLQQTLDRESARFGTSLSRSDDGTLEIWRG